MTELMYVLFKLKKAIFVEGINSEDDVNKYNEIYNKIVKILNRFTLIIGCFLFGYFFNNGFTLKLNFNILDWLIYITEGFMLCGLFVLIFFISELIDIVIPAIIIKYFLSFVIAGGIYSKLLTMIGKIADFVLFKPFTAIRIPGLTENLLGLVLFDLPVATFIIYLISSLKKHLELIKPLNEVVHSGITEEHRAKWEKKQNKNETFDEETWEDFDEYSQQSAIISKTTTFDFFTGCKTLEDVKTKYKKLSAIYHPDTGYGDTEIMKQINLQYETELEKYKE